MRMVRVLGGDRDIYLPEQVIVADKPATPWLLYAGVAAFLLWGW